MNNILKKAIKTTLEEWNCLTDTQKGKDFQESVNRLSTWLNELENENE